MFAICLNAANPQKVWIVANSNDADSLELAQFYANKRAIPQTNIIPLSLPTQSHISAQTYFAKLENPLLEKLSSAGALFVKKDETKDEQGRDNLKFIAHNIDYIVLIRGVPIGIQPSDEKFGAKTDAASVDSELSARFAPQKTRRGFIKNPLFGQFGAANQFSKLGILRVFRLDGVTKAEVKNSIESALRAEENGLRGRAYVDKSKREKSGDAMLDKTAKILEQLGFDTAVDEETTLFDFDKPMDAPAFYFGWYSISPQKYFKDKSFKLADGAICIHIFSFSAKDMRNPNAWAPRLVALGAGATVGNVYEPYLALTHNTSALALGLAKKMSFGEATYAALPALSWQNVNLGDPLYSPMKHDLNEQMRDLQNGKSDELSQYTVTRAMNIIARKKGTPAAVELGRHFENKVKPNYAITFKLAKIFKDNSDKTNALTYAKKTASQKLAETAVTRGLCYETAKMLAELGDGKTAMELCDELAQNKHQACPRLLIKVAKEIELKTNVKLTPNLKKIESYLKNLDERERAKKEKEQAIKNTNSKINHLNK